VKRRAVKIDDMEVPAIWMKHKTSVRDVGQHLFTQWIIQTASGYTGNNAWELFPQKLERKSILIEIH